MRRLTLPALAVLALLCLPACAERSYEGGMRLPAMTDDGTNVLSTERKRTVVGDPPGAMP